MSTRFPIRVQQMRSKGQQPRFYVYVPLALAAALGIEAGEEVHWELLDRDELHISIGTFETDITPPIGHPLCAGWYAPARGITNLMQIVAAIESFWLTVVKLPSESKCVTPGTA